MKKVLFLVMKQSGEALEVLQSLNKDGYNATIIATDSLHHAFLNNEEHHFYSLRHIQKETFNESTMGIFVSDDSSIEELKNKIREYTDSFKKVRGFMYSLPLNDYEGSF